MVAEENGSPGTIALELIESWHGMLVLGTNEGDQAFHRSIEEFEKSMRAMLTDCDATDVHFVAICLSSAYRRAINKGEGFATEEIKTTLRTVAMRLCEVNGDLSKTLRDGGQSGRLLAECVRTGNVNSRICL